MVLIIHFVKSNKESKYNNFAKEINDTISNDVFNRILVNDANHRLVNGVNPPAKETYILFSRNFKLNSFYFLLWFHKICGLSEKEKDLEIDFHEFFSLCRNSLSPEIFREINHWRAILLVYYMKLQVFGQFVLKSK